MQQEIFPTKTPGTLRKHFVISVFFVGDTLCQYSTKPWRNNDIG